MVMWPSIDGNVPRDVTALHYWLQYTYNTITIHNNLATKNSIVNIVQIYIF